MENWLCVVQQQQPQYQKKVSIEQTEFVLFFFVVRFGHFVYLAPQLVPAKSCIILLSKWI